MEISELIQKLKDRITDTHRYHGDFINPLFFLKREGQVEKMQLPVVATWQEETNVEQYVIHP